MQNAVLFVQCKRMHELFARGVLPLLLNLARLTIRRYDLDANDALWSAFIDLDFPTMAEGLDAEVAQEKNCSPSECS
jgi:hypothetical protein